MNPAEIEALEAIAKTAGEIKELHAAWHGCYKKRGAPALRRRLMPLVYAANDELIDRVSYLEALRANPEGC